MHLLFCKASQWGLIFLSQYLYNTVIPLDLILAVGFCKPLLWLSVRTKRLSEHISLQVRASKQDVNYGVGGRYLAVRPEVGILLSLFVLMKFVVCSCAHSMLLQYRILDEIHLALSGA